jgi:hypothetical protein
LLGRVEAIFVARGAQDLTTMPRIVDGNDIARHAVLTGVGKGIFYVAPGWRDSASIVHENDHVELFEALDIDQVSFHVFGIIVATALIVSRKRGGLEMELGRKESKRTRRYR